MKIKCIDPWKNGLGIHHNNPTCNLTLNKIYKVLKENDTEYLIRNDRGWDVEYEKDRFEKL